MRVLKTILLGLFILALLIFTFQNMEAVRLTFITWHVQMPLSIASVSLYVLGAFSGGLIFSMIKKLTTDDENEN